MEPGYEETLRKSEEEKRLILGSISELVIYHDKKLRIIWANRAASESAGLPTEKLVGGLCHEIWQKRSQPCVGCPIIKAIETGQPQEEEMATPDGKVWSVRGFPVRDEKGSIVGAVEVTLDITEHKRVEEALAESEEWHRALVGTAGRAGHGIIVVQNTPNREAAIVFANDEAYRMLSYSRDETLNMSAWDVFESSDELVAIQDRYRRRQRGEQVPSYYETTLRRKDGTSLPVETSVSTMNYHGRIATVVYCKDITERKRVEEALAQSEEWHRALVDTAGKAGIGITIVQDMENCEAAVVFANDEYCRMSGYSLYELLSMSAWKLIAPGDLALIQDRYRRRQSGENIVSHYQETVLRKDGTLLSTEISASTIIYLGKTATVTYYVDVSERGRVERALAESEEWHRALVDAAAKAGLGIEIVQNTDEREAAIVFVNDEYCKMSGYSRDELLAMSEWELIAPGDLASVQDKYRRRQRGEDVIGLYETTLLCKDGTLLPIETSVSTMTYRGKIATVSYFRNITERKQTQQELNRHRQHLEELVEERTTELKGTNEQLQREIIERKRAEDAVRKSERYFRSLIEDAMDGIAIVDRDGTMRYESPALERLLGYKLDDQIGKNSLELVHPDDLTTVVEIFGELIKNPGSIGHIEVRGHHKDGSWRTLEIVGRNLINDPVVGGIVANFRDITERKQAEEKLQELYRQEKELRVQLEAEMKRRVEFTRALAHELKTPLTPVLISSQVLVSELKDEPMLSLARNISRGASNLNSRIDELLDLAKGEIGMLQLKAETLDVLQLLKDILEDVAPVALSRSQTLTSQLPRSLPLIKADKVRLRQIVLNLLNNAFKFTPEGGKISLKARKRDANLIVEVKDTGPGIGEEEQGRLFKPYQQLESDRERLSGLGLGLALCKTLVELHGGRIWVKSRVGKGSNFGFSLPLEGVSRQRKKS